MTSQLASTGSLRTELDSLRSEVTDAREKTALMESRLAASEARAQHAQASADQHDAELRASLNREAQLREENARLLLSEEALGRRMAAERASASAECGELRATITHLREQNRALRTRLVTLHATIHGMQDGRADSRVEIEERLRKGREAVSDL